MLVRDIVKYTFKLLLMIKIENLPSLETVANLLLKYSKII